MVRLLFVLWFISWHDPSSFLCAGIVVEDCLLLLVNLLKNNSSNQNFFKEGSYIQRMKPWFEVGDDNSGWSAQKVTNLHLMLQVTQNSHIKLLLKSPNYQFIMLINILFLLPAGASHGVSSELSWSYSQLSEVHVPVWPAAAVVYHPHGHWCARWHPHWSNHDNKPNTENSCSLRLRYLKPNCVQASDLVAFFQTINTVSEVIRGSQVNQDYFASVNAPSNPPR